jgi:hypothetical protein
MYLLFVENHKTEAHNKTEYEEYRKIPLHEFVVKKIQEYIIKNEKKRDDFLFMGNNKNKIVVNYKKTTLSILLPFIALEHSKSLAIEGVTENMSIFSEEYKKHIEKYTKSKNYHYYSFRHTLTTILGLEKINPDFNDYLTGHKLSGEMRANYTHINAVDNGLFCREYGRTFLKIIDKYFFPKNRNERYREKEEKLKDFVSGLEKTEEEPINNMGIFEVV